MDYIDFTYEICKIYRLLDIISILQSMSSMNIDHCLNPIERNIISRTKRFFFDDVLNRIEFQWRKLYPIVERKFLCTRFVGRRISITGCCWREYISFLFCTKTNSFPHSNAEVETL